MRKLEIARLGVCAVSVEDQKLCIYNLGGGANEHAKKEANDGGSCGE